MTSPQTTCYLCTYLREPFQQHHLVGGNCSHQHNGNLEVFNLSTRVKQLLSFPWVWPMYTAHGTALRHSNPPLRPKVGPFFCSIQPNKHLASVVELQADRMQWDLDSLNLNAGSQRVHDDKHRYYVCPGVDGGANDECSSAIRCAGVESLFSKLLVWLYFWCFALAADIWWRSWTEKRKSRSRHICFF